MDRKLSTIADQMLSNLLSFHIIQYESYSLILIGLELRLDLIKSYEQDFLFIQGLYLFFRYLIIAFKSL